MVLIGLTQQIVICLCVAWNRVTNSVHQGSLWEGAVSQRLTEGESPGFFDAVSYEALVIDQRSLPQSASRPAPSQREPLVHPAKFQFGRQYLRTMVPGVGMLQSQGHCKRRCAIVSGKPPQQNVNLSFPLK